MNDCKIYNLFIAGNATVGKTSLIRKYFKNEFEEFTLATVGIQIEEKDIMIDNERVRMRIQDTSGQERYRSICPKYYQKAHGIILAFGLDDRESFEQLKSWLDEIKLNASINISIVITGCKCDLPRKVSFKEANEYAENEGIAYIETSAKTNENINELFDMIAWEIKNKGIENQSTPKGDIDLRKSYLEYNNSSRSKCSC